jgi:hypothetical protein
MTTTLRVRSNTVRNRIFLRWRIRALVSISFAVVGCATHHDIAPERVDGGSDQKCTSPLVEGDAAAEPYDGGQALVGTFHTGVGDAINLELRADGTFRWSIMACDASESVRGSWAADGSTVNLEPVEAFSNRFGNPVTRMQVLRDVSHVTLRIWSNTSFSDEPLSPGGVCAICCIYIPQHVEPCSRPWFGG